MESRQWLTKQPPHSPTPRIQWPLALVWWIWRGVAAVRSASGSKNVRPAVSDLWALCAVSMCAVFSLLAPTPKKKIEMLFFCVRKAATQIQGNPSNHVLCQHLQHLHPQGTSHRLARGEAALVHAVSRRRGGAGGCGPVQAGPRAGWVCQDLRSLVSAVWRGAQDARVLRALREERVLGERTRVAWWRREVGVLEVARGSQGAEAEGGKCAGGGVRGALYWGAAAAVLAASACAAAACGRHLSSLTSLLWWGAKVWFDSKK